MSESLLGNLVGSVRIERLLDDSIADIVLWEGRDVGTMEPRWVVELSPHLASDEEVQARWAVQGGVLKSFSHPYVLSCLEVVDVEGFGALLVLEAFPDAKPLHEYRAKLSQAQLLVLFSGLADAIQAAHHHQVDGVEATIQCELDLKHIFVSMHQETFSFRWLCVPSLKLGSSFSQTRAGVVKGIGFQYMSPEMVKGQETTQASDFFKLGSILVETVTGQPAFQGDSDFELLEKVRAGRSDAVNQAELSDELRSLTTALLRPDPERRLSQAGELKARLQVAFAPAPGDKFEREQPQAAESAVGPGVETSRGGGGGAEIPPSELLLGGGEAERGTQDKEQPRKKLRKRSRVAKESLVPEELAAEKKRGISLPELPAEPAPEPAPPPPPASLPAKRKVAREEAEAGPGKAPDTPVLGSVSRGTMPAAPAPQSSAAPAPQRSAAPAPQPPAAAPQTPTFRPPAPARPGAPPPAPAAPPAPPAPGPAMSAPVPASPPVPGGPPAPAPQVGGLPVPPLSIGARPEPAPEVPLPSPKTEQSAAPPAASAPAQPERTGADGGYGRGQIEEVMEEPQEDWLERGLDAEEAEETFAGMAPEGSAGPAEHTVTVLRRKGVVRSYTQMNPGKIFPLLVSIVEAELYIKIPDLPQVQQIESEQVLEIKETSPYVRIVPVLPGCLVSPQEAVVDVRKEKVDVEFWVAPQSEGDLTRSARIQIWHDGLLKDEIPIPCQVVTQTLTRVASYSSVLSSLSGALLETYGKKLTPPTGTFHTEAPSLASYVIQKTVSVLSSSGIWLGLFFLLTAFLCYLWLQPKRGDVIERFLSTDLH